MSTPFDTIADSPSRVKVVIGRTVEPGYLDLPCAVVDGIDYRGSRTLGDVVPVRDLTLAELDNLETTLADFEADAKKQIASLRREIEDRRFVIDVAEGFAIGTAA